MCSSKVASALGVIAIVLAASVSSVGAEASLFLQNGFAPAWSPDGTAIACTRPTPTWSDEDMQVWVAPLAGTSPDTLTRDPSGAFFAQWLSDGQHVVYFRSGEFVIVELSGGTPTVWGVPDVYDDLGMAMAPDGRLLYTRNVGAGSLHTWALDLETGTSQFVVAGAGGVISPDGQSIAYMIAGDTLVVAGLGQAPTVQLGVGAFPSWTPDSRYLVYTGFGPGDVADLYLVSRDGVIRRQLTDDPEIEWHGKISPTGTRVAYSRSISDVQPHDVWLLDLEVPPTLIEARSWSAVKSHYRGTGASKQ